MAVSYYNISIRNEVSCIYFSKVNQGAAPATAAMFDFSSPVDAKTEE
jgi:hypothetical protein